MTRLAKTVALLFVTGMLVTACPDNGDEDDGEGGGGYGAAAPWMPPMRFSQ